MHLSETHHISGCHAFKMSGITPHQHISTIIELVGQIQTQDTGLLIPVPTCAQENATAASGKANGFTLNYTLAATCITMPTFLRLHPRRHQKSKNPS